MLLCLLIAVYHTHIYIKLRFQRHDNNDNILIRVYAWRGLLSYVIKVPVVEVDWRDEMLWLESEMKETKGNRRVNTVFERHLIKKIVDFICWHPRRFRRLVNKMREKIGQTRLIIRELQRKVRFDQLHCNIKFGMEDAAGTALAAGSFWLVRGLLLPAMYSRMALGVRPVCRITPVFGKDILAVELECILRIRLGNIIYALYNADKQGGDNRG